MVVLDDRGTGTATTSSCSRPGRPRGCPAIQGVAYDEGLVDGVFVLKDMADATGHRRGGRARASGPWCSAPACSGSRWRQGWPAAGSRCASCTSPTGSWSASSAGRPRRWRWPACSGSASPPTWGPRSSASGPGAGALESVRFGDGAEAGADLFVMCTRHRARDRAGPQGRADGRPRRRRRRRAGEPRRPARARHRRLRAAAARAHRPGRPGLAAGDPARRRADRRGLDRGPPSATHDVVRVKATGMSMVSMGVCGDFDRDDPRYRVLSLKDPERRALRRGRRLAAGASSARPASATPTSPPPSRRSTPARCRCPTTRPCCWCGRSPGRHGIRGEAAGGAGRRRPGVHLQHGAAGRIRDAVRGGCGPSPRWRPRPGRARAAATAPRSASSAARPSIDTQPRPPSPSSTTRRDRTLVRSTS